MKALLEYVLSDFWRFLQCCVFLMIIAFWKPIEINIVHDNRSMIDDESEIG